MFVRISIATVVALSTLFVGVLETALADVAPPGISRTRPHDLDAVGCVSSGAGAEADADSDDGDDDPRDPCGLACVAPAPAAIESIGHGAPHAGAGIGESQHTRATDLIRGPPASR